MCEKLQIFENQLRFDDAIVKEQIRTYHPQINSYGNSDIVEFIINQSDLLLYFHDADIVIDGKFIVSGTGTGTCLPTNNFGSFLFESGTYELNGKELDKVCGDIQCTIKTNFIFILDFRCEILESRQH